MSNRPSLPRRALAEVLGTGFLLLAIVGSGIAADRLTDDLALTLLINAIVTGAALTAMITAVGPVSGAHLNPAVTVAIAMERGLPWREVPLYVGAQVAGAAIGVVAANLMFDLPAVALAQTGRAGAGLWLGEFIATFGLLTVIWGTVRSHPGATVAVAVGLYVTAAIWFTSSAGFANPAVTVGRIFTDSYTGIAPLGALPFVAIQFSGAAAATLLFRWLLPNPLNVATKTVVPHEVRR